jgi:hypothetical protein
MLNNIVKKFPNPQLLGMNEKEPSIEFKTYFKEIIDKCSKGNVKDPGPPFKNKKTTYTDIDIDNGSMPTSVKIMIGTVILLIIGLLIFIIIHIVKKK